MTPQVLVGFAGVGGDGVGVGVVCDGGGGVGGFAEADVRAGVLLICTSR
jgi:hypothetical protein